MAQGAKTDCARIERIRLSLGVARLGSGGNRDSTKDGLAVRLQITFPKQVIAE
jgi:hypothetical protein